jgi:very-short-patch-repair endonuclease
LNNHADISMETTEHTRNLAKRLRRRMNTPEVRLWIRVRRNQLDGIHIRRQHPLGPYVLDFFCARAKLAIEVDGGAHDDDRRERDNARDAWLAMRGIRTLRLPASLVMEDMEAALAAIRRRLNVL